jgi:hypothetical protein
MGFLSAFPGRSSQARPPKRNNNQEYFPEHNGIYSYGPVNLVRWHFRPHFAVSREDTKT